MNNYCRNCGEQLNGATTCPKCGVRVRNRRINIDEYKKFKEKQDNINKSLKYLLIAVFFFILFLVSTELIKMNPLFIFVRYICIFLVLANIIYGIYVHGVSEQTKHALIVLGVIAGIYIIGACMVLGSAVNSASDTVANTPMPSSSFDYSGCD